MLLGKAIRIALQLGLHSRPGSRRLSPVEAETRKRTWYNCVILDRVLSMTFGRPTTIAKELIRLDLPLNCTLDALAASPDGQIPTANAPPATACFFTATIQLYDIMNSILESVYDHNMDVEALTPLPEILKHGVSMAQRILSWQDGLPPDLLRRPWKQDWQQAPTSFYYATFDKLSAVLHLRYLNICLLLHRAILDRFLRCMDSTGGERFANAHDQWFLDAARRSLQESEWSAMETIDIVWRMSHRPGALGAWW